MKADTPVPDGFVHFDLVPEDRGLPYLTFKSQFALAVFAANSCEALHKKAGFDSDAMYDVTRNIILGEDVLIPYPEIYWTAEVSFDRGDGIDSKSGKVRAGYLFSVDLDVH